MTRQEIKSSMLRSCAYSAEKRLLEVEFQGKNGPGAIYRYSEVPAEIYEAFLKAESKGQYFGKCIRNAFAAKKVEREPDAPSETPDAAPSEASE